MNRCYLLFFCHDLLLCGGFEGGGGAGYELGDGVFFTLLGGGGVGFGGLLFPMFLF